MWWEHNLYVFTCRYSPNYVTPLTTAESVSKNEILDYTGSPHHCVNVGLNEGAAIKCSTSWQDDYQRCQKELYGFNPCYSPDPWRPRKHSQTTANTRPVNAVHYTGCAKIDFDDETADGGEISTTNNVPVVVASDSAPMVSHDEPDSTSSRSTGKYIQ